MKNGHTLALSLVFLGLACVTTGCAMFRGGSGDEQLLREILRTYEAALDEGEVDKLISLYSEDYVSPDGADYEEATERLRRIVPMLERWEVEVSTLDTKIEITGETATLRPIIFQSPRGERSLKMVATKEPGGVWRITSTEMEER